MHTPASIKRHPIHPMLIVIPLGLWTFSFVSQLIALWSVNAAWSVVARYCAGAGVIGALVAAIPGLVDLLSLRDRKTQRTGVTHMVLNLVAVVVWAVDFFVLRGPSVVAPFVISVVGMVLICFSGWIGSNLIYRHRVGVETPAEPELLERRAG